MYLAVADAGRVLGNRDPIARSLADRTSVGCHPRGEVAAAAMGVPIVKMELAAFAIGACTAGVGGVVYAEQVGFISPPTFNVVQSILILSMVVIGGMGSISGAIIGAAIVVLLPECSGASRTAASSCSGWPSSS